MEDLDRLYDRAKVGDAVNNSLITGKIISENPRRNGYIGDFKGVPVHVDPECPPGKIYFLNDNYKESCPIDTRSRWQHFVDWLKGRLGRHSVV